MIKKLSIIPREHFLFILFTFASFDLLVQSRFQSFLIVPHRIVLLIEKLIFSSDPTLK